MSKKRIALLLVLGVIVATTLVLALNVTAQAQGYGAVSSGTGGTPSTGAEVALFAAAGGAMLGAGYFLTRKSKA